MSTDNIDDETQQILNRYQAFLEDRQRNATPGDIRNRILRLRRKKVAIGYLDRNIRSGFASGLNRLFDRPVGLSVANEIWNEADTYLCSGAIHPDAQHSHPGANRIFGEDTPFEDIVLFEMGFLASAFSWSHAFGKNIPESVCLGYVYDDIAHYYMADYPNRLIDRLNSDWEPSPQEVERARGLMDRIVRRRISKYNAQPFDAPEMTPGYTHRVLVCDQSFADASTVYGKIDERGFQDMLVAAIRENPGAEVIVKTHPDTAWVPEKRAGYYTHLEDYENVRILRDPVNPFVLFDHVDKVYVGTSGLGLEALFAGKKVVCFGAPFYGGWGLTDDRQPMMHRNRARSLEAVFDAFYNWYTIYHVPGVQVPSQVEDALDYIERHRPFSQSETRHDVAGEPTVSVVLPVYEVEQYVESSIRSIQRQSLENLEIIPVIDASPDESGEIIRRMAETDPRIRPIFLKENVGQGFARNEGIDAARGRYVWFLDSDDELTDPEFLKEVVSRAEADGVDMVRARKAIERVETEEGYFRRDRDDPSEINFDGVNLSGVTLPEAPQVHHNRHFWLWLYRRDFLNRHDIRFVTRNWEERAFLTKALLAVDRLSVADLSAVRYRVRQNSTARRAKSVGDSLAMVANLENVCAQFAEVNASDPDSPAHPYFRFNITQMLHYVFFGFPHDVLTQAEDPQEWPRALERIGNALAQSGFTAQHLTDEPQVVNRMKFNRGAYDLIAEAAIAKDTELVEMAVTDTAISQDRLLAQFRSDPCSRLSAAMNRYFRNDRVAPGRPGRAVDTSKVRVVFHIGSTKSGSTFLQHWLDTNRPTLLDMGYYVPEVGLYRQKDRPQKTAGHSTFLTDAARGDRSLVNSVLSALASQKGRIHTVILSSEAFFLASDATRLVESFNGFERQMLVYLRRQDDWANSQYCEFVGGGAISRTTFGIDAWLESPKTRANLDYSPLVEHWAELVGEGNVTVRPYEFAQFEGNSLLLDFCATIGIEPDARLREVPDRMRNEAMLSAPYLDLMRHFNGQRFSGHDSYFRFVDSVHRIAAAHQDGPVPKPDMLGPGRRAALMDAHVEDNARIARRFLGREDGQLFYDTEPRPAPVAAPPIPQAALAEIFAAFAREQALIKRQEKAAREGSARSDDPLFETLGSVRLGKQLASLPRDYFLLRSSSLFNPSWYLSANADVAAQKSSPYLHFLRHGFAEGRNPGPEFDMAGYYRKNRDVLESGQNALIHYLRFGRDEGREL